MDTRRPEVNPGKPCSRSLTSAEIDSANWLVLPNHDLFILDQFVKRANGGRHVNSGKMSSEIINDFKSFLELYLCCRQH